MNDSFLSEHGKVLSSEIALSVLFLIYEKPRKYNELRDIIYPMIRTKQRVEDGKNMHAYYLRKLKKIQAIKLKKSLDNNPFRGLYEITERGKLLIKLVKQAQIEIKLADSQEQLTRLSNNQKSKQNHEVRAL
jgi:DNA-binding HxlR family transcriptional regulator